MNTAAFSFTPLECLLLYQSVCQRGIDSEAFVQISATLRNNSYIRSDKSYNADRLSSESLQQFFLHLLREELKVEDQYRSNGGTSPASGSAANSGAGNLSPNSKKRKLPSPTLLALTDLYHHFEILPVLGFRLYNHYRSSLCDSIHDDERKIGKLQADIRDLETEEEKEKEKEGRERQAKVVSANAVKSPTGTNGTTSAAPLATAPRLADGKAQNDDVPKPPPAATPAATILPAAGTQQQQPTPPAKPQSAPSSTTTPDAQKPPPLETFPLAAPHTITESVPLPTEISQTRPSPPQPHQTTTPTPGSGPVVHIPQTPQPRPSSKHPPAPLQPQGTATPSPAGLVASIAPGPVSKPRSQTPPDVQPGTAEKAPIPIQSAQALTAPQKPLPPQQPAQQPSQSTGQVKLPPPAAAQGPTQPSTPTPRAGSGFPKPVPASAPAPLPVPHAALQPPTQTATPQILAEVRTEAPRYVLPPVKPSHILIQPQPDRHAHAQRQGSHVSGVLQESAPPATTSPAPSTLTKGIPAPHTNRSLLPQHVQTPGSSVTPTPSQSQPSRPRLPHTPGHVSLAGFLPRGSGTRWKSNEPTPSTPGPDVGGIASPAYEPLSPVMGSSSRSMGAESTQRHHRQPKRPQTTGSRPRGRPPRNPKPPVDPVAESGHTTHPNIKHEASTPRAFDDIGETTAEEGGAANESSTASPSGLSTRPLKRKREDSVDFASPDKSTLSSLMRRRLLGPAVPPTHVLWMRGFPKISASALDQISSHRNANMFAHKIRDRDAPGYDSIVRHPVDLKMVRMAIMQGNKAATAAAAALPESEQSSSSSLWLPISEELVPPRGIINSSQLECELVHMFANAIMYNPDSHRGPGPTFMESEATEEETGTTDVSGNSARYKVDEDGVVNDTRGMYIEVEKLLSEMRSAERQRGVPQPPPSARGLGLSVDGGGGGRRLEVGADVERNGDADAEPDVDDGDGADATEDDEAHGPQDGAEDEAEGSAADGGDSSGTKRRRLAQGL
ncbi:hmg-i/hmg-y, DNA-binding protein [Grosmannia clavigera kw1407]|uniref:Hmg-i/hmg-y, DNA-binding protein n=1 Tax=Grosmannia clavigera (strain kw1407 / UAMH 11150) TaxID=655863 RepID=F0X7D5_GROCL|nr:hmg-i/hmg-y, DNA-binding protein [Grosmannia clavigera kw1407]EFX06415.1 hmg-i/hmg-y, DNA-binding protein [Grosmannia clavigera kw1407]